MKASIELTDRENIMGNTLLRQCADTAARALVEGGGCIEQAQEPWQWVWLYKFEGPDELVRDLVTAMMTFKLDAR